MLTGADKAEEMSASKGDHFGSRLAELYQKISTMTIGELVIGTFLSFSILSESAYTR